MIAEALDTAITLGLALLAWIVVLAAVGTIVVLTAVATGAWAVRTLWRHTAGPSWRRSAFHARIHARRRARPAESHTDDHHYQEAA